MLVNLAGRIFMAIGFLTFFLLFTFQAIVAFADSTEYHVVKVVRNLQMSEADPIYKDYYINAGKLQGIAKGMVIPIVRRLTVQDAFKNIIDDKVMFPVAKIKIIAVHDKIAIGRLHSLESAANHGVLEFQGVMTGDKVDIGAAEMAKEASVQAPESVPMESVVQEVSFSSESPEAKIPMELPDKNPALVKPQLLKSEVGDKMFIGPNVITQ